MRLFGAYLKSRKKIFGGLLLLALIFAAAFFLYHLPWEALLYPTAVCLLLGLIIGLLDFLQLRKKHAQLQQLKQSIGEQQDKLPNAENIIEADYQQIIQELCTQMSQAETQATLKYQDMIDYYTVWAHQIKTPIAAMKLALQNEDSSLSRSLSADLFRIGQYAEMVLAFLRLDSDSSDYLFREYELDAIIRQSVKKFAAEFIQRKISLEYRPTKAKIITDEKWLSFVIEQILSNARKYTRSGSIRIELQEPKTLCISDTGIGIAPEDLPRIFEKGYTGYNGRIDKSASGIGLYLCKRICQNLSIGISAQSTPGQGTSIRLVLEQYQLRRE